MLTCYFIRKRLIAYLHGEVPLNARRRIARHLEQCSSCRAEYTRQREQVHDLKRDLGQLGQPTPAQLKRVWTAVQAEMTGTAPKPRPSGMLKLRYAFAAALAAVMLTMLAPLANAEGAQPTLPSQAFAPTAIAEVTDTPTNVGRDTHTNAMIVFATGDVTLKPQAALTPTPAGEG